MKIISSAVFFACLILGCGSYLLAQEKGPWAPGQTNLYADVISDPEVSYADSTSAMTAATTGDLPAADQSGPSGSGTTQGGTAASGTGNDGQWHFVVAPYLWLPGVHGTVGAFDKDAGFKASAVDILSHARFAFLGAAEARRNRFIANIDTLYMRLQASNSIPFPPGLAQSATVKASVFILTPKIGVRLINAKAIKVDALAGIRYWYFGENLQFYPSYLGLNFSKSQDWVDPVVGGRIEGALSPKTVVTVAGDAGGWGTGSQLEYQVVGLLGYRYKPNMILQAGYRYLYFDKEKAGPSNAFAKAAFSGIVLGATINLK